LNFSSTCDGTAQFRIDKEPKKAALSISAAPSRAVISAYQNKLSPRAQAVHPFEIAWEQAFASLATFKAREGHCRVPMRHVEGTFNLGFWVRRQRKNRETIPLERMRRLDEMGFVWNARERAWEEGFAALTMFKAREGHCRVPIKHNEGSFKLGKWVDRQRMRRHSRSAERKQRLDAIGFIWRTK
jgi:hypothetical protein